MIWLPLNTFYVYFEAEEPEALPAVLFSTFRRAFGQALKRLSCVGGRYRTCVQCPLCSDCAYGYLFETPRPPEDKCPQEYPYIEHPFAFALPFPYEKKNPLQVRMTLVGNALRFFPHVVLAFEALAQTGLGGKRVRLRLISIREKHTERILYREGKIWKIEPFPQPRKNPSAKSLVINFLTLTALQSSRKIVKPEELEFHILIRNLLHRVSMLSHFHSGTPLDVDFKGLIAQAEKIKTVSRELSWVRFTRRSARTGETYSLKGFVGKVKFAGDFSPFSELLHLGTYVQVGRHTSFGFGYYEIL